MFSEEVMEYLQKPEINKLLQVSHEYGNREAHLALLVMYATGTRVSQALNLKGIDVMPDPVTGGHRRCISVRTWVSPASAQAPTIVLSKLNSLLFGDKQHNCSRNYNQRDATH